jgi:cell division transport system permease protein
MTIAIRQMGRAIWRGLDGARRSPLIQLVAIGTIALCLTLVGGVRLVAENVNRLSSGWGSGAEMAVFLEDGISTERAEKIAAAVAKIPGAEGARLVSSDEAWQRLRRSLGARATLLDGVESSFMPVTIEVALKPGVADTIRSHPAFDKLRRAPGVEEVELLGEWAGRLRALAALLGEIGLWVGLLVAAACLYIVASTIRLGVFARRDEIEILKLVGATRAFVRGPFLVEGVLQGALGAAAAAGLLYGLFRMAQPRVETVLADVLLAGPVRFFGPTQLALAIFAGALLGLCGSWLALGRHVKT